MLLDLPKIRTPPFAASWFLINAASIKVPVDSTKNWLEAEALKKLLRALDVPTKSLPLESMRAVSDQLPSNFSKAMLAFAYWTIMLLRAHNIDF